jgi:predicted transcriptional regulator of viral defense system
MLDGSDLEAAAAKARQDRVTSGLGDRSAEVAAVVMARPDGVRAADVVEALDLDEKTARTYLSRLVGAGRIERASRGLYVPPVASVASVALQHDDPFERNTHNTRNTP